MKSLDIGIDSSHRKQISEGLGHLLADSYVLLLKTQNYHWNVTGPLFESLHRLFETQYNELFEAVDLIAERIRALGSFAPATFGEFSQLSTISQPGGRPKAMEMVKSLLNDHETVVKTIGDVFPKAQAGSDEATIDLLNQRLMTHQKAVWMLRSLLEE